MTVTKGRAERKRVKPAEERRRDLLDAGLGVLTDKGYDGTTVEEITAAAGVAKGTFYLYFGSKTDLVLALRREIWGQITSEVTKRTASGKRDWWALFDAWIDVYVRFLIDNRQVHDVLWHGSAGSNLSDDPDPMDAIAEAIAEGAAAGSFSVEDPLLAAAMLFYGVHGTVETALARGRISRTRLQSVSRALARRLLAPKVLTD